ncbi:MAG TPA: zinc-dependent peptidase [Marinobacter sp.]|uniref:Zinc-dependent peptidase n=2 Tax=root TaxID=1 RepID=A0A831VXU0_9GAMM|nr:M90 family metallopeptidase [Marinobacter antarcticus]HDZ39174.1 zinc-dependent peptidase [Marinobacter sp.]HEA51135.1 zinc-dependent peptidase [Marinobacter antarcticus]
MSPITLFAVFAVAGIALAIFYLFFYRAWRRTRELKQPFPKAWRKHLQSTVPLYRKLSAPLQQALERQVQLFLSEKHFYGCDGFEVTDRVRVAIAGHACLLILKRSYTDFDEVRSILVYPDVYRVQASERDGMVVGVSNQVRAGEASSLGQVVLAWSECESGAITPESTHNVILHEFAHQLDYLDGTADGAPPLSGEHAKEWQQTMTIAYDDLRHSLRHHRTSWLDPYGATKPAEFFAVLTETFYQQPHHLKEQQPAVYNLLCDFYRLDPGELARS